MIPVLKQSLTRVLALALPLFSAALHAEDAPISPEHKKFFEDKVQPILAKACVDSKPRRCVSMPSYPDVARKSMQGTTTGEYNYALAA